MHAMEHKTQRREETAEICELRMTENFPKLTSDTKAQTPDAPRTPCRSNLFRNHTSKRVKHVVWREKNPPEKPRILHAVNYPPKVRSNKDSVRQTLRACVTSRPALKIP